MSIPQYLISEFVTQTGAVEVSMDLGLTPPFITRDDFDIYDMGNIDYDYDVTSYGSVVNNLGAMYNRTKIICALYSKGNLNILDILEDILASGANVVPVKITVNTHKGQTYEFVYEIRSNGLKYDENSLRLSIELDPPLLPTLTIGGVFTAVTDKYLVGETFGASVSGIMVGSFISYFVKQLNTTSGIGIIYEPAPTTTGYSSLTYQVPFIFPPDGIQLWMIGGGSGLAVEDVSRYAVLGGDIYGTGFSNNFYVHRARTDRVAQVEYDEIEALQYSFTPSPYKTIVLTMDGEASTNIVDTTVTSSGNRFAEKAISGLYSLPSYIRKAKSTTGILFSDTDYSGYTSSDIESVIVGSGIDAHKKALNAQTAPLFRTEVTIFGFDKVKPWEVVQFIGDVPDRYKYTTGTNPRYFRPTSLSYDLMGDKVKLKMYSIS